MANIFLAIPTYNGLIEVDTAAAAYGGSQRHRVFVVPLGKSLLSSNCNSLLAMAYNEQQRLDLDWFAMLHADVAPEPNWLDTLIDEAQRVGADLMSAAVAIKNTKGLSSIGIGYDSESWRQCGRITMRQLHEPGFPQTFNIEDVSKILSVPTHFLLANTGCMVFRLRGKKWPLSVCFETRDGLRRLPDGTVQAYDLSEDWYFSREIAKCGGHVFCTTKVKVDHYGKTKFPNDSAWGTVADDCDREATCIVS